MINIVKLLKKETIEENLSIDTGKGIKADLVYWSDKFLSYVNSSTKSKETLRSYEFITSSIIDYIDGVSKHKYINANLSDFDSIKCNEFLEYLENFTINREYGILEYRIEILFRFVDDILNCKNIASFLSLPGLLANKYSVQEMETFEYMINEFAEYLKGTNGQPNEINNNYIKNYIAGIKKLSNKTMQQRKAALQSFLSYIDKSMKCEHFKSFYWELNSYPLPKQNSKVLKCAFDEVLVEKLLYILTDYPLNIGMYKNKVYKNSIYSAYKNTFLILIMMCGGARASEAVHIKFSDIESFKTEEGSLMHKITVLGKGNKERHLYIKSHQINRHLEYLKGNRGVNEYISGKTSIHKPMSTQGLYMFAKMIFQLAESDKKGLHIFRHHFASNFAEKNGNIKLLQELLDHVNISTTMIYSDIREKIKIDALNEL